MPPTIEELQAAADKAAADLEAAKAAEQPRTAGNVAYELVSKIVMLLGNHPELGALLKELQSLEPEFAPVPPADTSADASAAEKQIPLYPSAPHHAIEPEE